jgi:xanthine dehydrogenase YagR molybdenum-binding subunit
VISPFVGGGFGCKGQVWSHVVLAAMAAKRTNRPVRLVLGRPQMFGPVGARPRTHQQVTLGATREGKLTAIRHEVDAHTSMIENYLEVSVFPTRMMYACPNVATVSRVVPLNLGTPTYARAPGVATGTYALEVAMDELAYALKMDPLELRLRNYAEIDPENNVPFSEKSLRECYARGAERFGWSKRNPEPRSMRDGRMLIGWGMATETYPGRRMPANALVRILPNGRIVVQSGTQEIGTGMYTIMAQVAADVLGVSSAAVDAQLSDTNFPEGPISAGSMSTASVAPVVQQAAVEARSKLVLMATSDTNSPLHGLPPDQIECKGGRLFLKSAPDRGESLSELLQRRGDQAVEAIASSGPVENKPNISSFGAIFAEISVDPDAGFVHTRRIVAV